MTKGLSDAKTVRFILKRDYQLDFDEQFDSIEKDLYELSKYKDFKEELGIDLITLFKALNEGVYVIDSDENIIFEEPMLSFNQEKNTNLYVLDSVSSYPPNKLCKSYFYYLKDYGKTWALTEEELKNDK